MSFSKPIFYHCFWNNSCFYADNLYSVSVVLSFNPLSQFWCWLEDLRGGAKRMLITYSQHIIETFLAPQIRQLKTTKQQQEAFLLYNLFYCELKLFFCQCCAVKLRYWLGLTCLWWKSKNFKSVISNCVLWRTESKVQNKNLPYAKYEHIILDWQI